MSAASESMLDDHDLLQDSLIRSLHRAHDGHLAATHAHRREVLPSHNVAVLYTYLRSGNVYVLDTVYVWSRVPRVYSSWVTLVNKEVDRLNRNSSPKFYGVYGWITATIKFTPLRTGDLFITVNKNGARGVRLTFGTGKTFYETRMRKA